MSNSRSGCPDIPGLNLPRHQGVRAACPSSLLQPPRPRRRGRRRRRMHGHTHRFFASPAPIGRNGHRLKDQAAPRRHLFSGLFRHPPDLSPEMTVALCAASSSPRRRHCPATAAPRFFIANIPFPRRLASTALSNPKRAASSTRRAARGNPRPRRPLARAHRRDGVVIRQRELSGDAQAMQSWGLQALFTPSSRQDPR